MDRKLKRGPGQLFVGRRRQRVLSPSNPAADRTVSKLTVVPPSEPTRVRYDVDSLTDVALRVFRERGYDATSMEHLASAAGITKAAFYHHIGGKEELLRRGFDRALDALFTMLEEPGATTGSAIERLRYVVIRIVELADALLPEVTVLLRTRGNSHIERAALERRRQFDRQVGAIVALAQEENSVASIHDPQLAARLLIGMANSIVEWYQPSGRLKPRELAETVASLALSGIAKPT